MSWQFWTFSGGSDGSPFAEDFNFIFDLYRRWWLYHPVIFACRRLTKSTHECIKHVDIASSISGDISSQSCFFKLPECNCAIKSIKSFHLPPPGFCVFSRWISLMRFFARGLTLTKNIRLGFGILYSFYVLGESMCFFSQSSLKHIANLTFSRNLPKETCQFYPPPPQKKKWMNVA